MGRRKVEEVGAANVDLTSCLDMIFNILAFFVLTFNPPKPEKNFDVALPPPKPQESTAPSETDLMIEPEAFEDVTINVSAGPDGVVGAVRIEGKQVQGGITRLATELRRMAQAIGGAGGDKLSAANIVADPKLKYRHIIEVVDACYFAQIQKINFIESAGAP